MRDHAADVQKYIDGALSGDITVGRLVRACIERHLRDLETGAERGLYFDPDSANNAINFFPLLRHSTGEFCNERFELRLWQKFLVWVLFGWRRVSDDSRRFRYAFIEIARGNGKSPLAAALALLLMIADTPVEARAEVWCVATKRDQAKVVYDEARRMVELSPPLRKHLDMPATGIFHPASFSSFKPLGSDSKTQDGFVPHAIVMDELHAWGERHRGLREKLETAMGKRYQPLMVKITTAGDNTSLLWEEDYEFNKKVTTGLLEADDYFAFIAEIDDEDSPFDESCWPKANPMLNEPHSPVKIDYLRSLATRAKDDPVKKHEMTRYHCNRKVAGLKAVITKEMWECGNKPLPDLTGRACYGGFDWGWRDDLAALGLVFPMPEMSSEERKVYCVKCYAWIPEGGKRDTQHAPFVHFVNKGELIRTPGNTTDPAAIDKVMEEVLSTYELKSLAFDPNNCREFGTKCVNEWGIETFEFFQTCRKYNEPVRDFLDAISEGRIIHGGNKLLGWAASNLCLRQDSNEYVMPDKANSIEKIDPIVAVLMGFSEAMFAVRQQPSIYETRGLQSISELG